MFTVFCYDADCTESAKGYKRFGNAVNYARKQQHATRLEIHCQGYHVWVNTQTKEEFEMREDEFYGYPYNFPNWMIEETA
jgi:hypothetical protein